MLCRSLPELCTPDRKNDVVARAGWIASKTPNAAETWIADPQLALIAALVGKDIAGVGVVKLCGEVLHLYVSPDHRFGGVRDRWLRHVVDRRNAHCLTSTFTATGFCRKREWGETVQAVRDGVPMRLQAAPEV